MGIMGNRDRRRVPLEGLREGLLEGLLEGLRHGAPRPGQCTLLTALLVGVV